MRRTLSYVAILWLLVPGQGCSTDDSGGGSNAEGGCETDSQCDEGDFCFVLPGAASGQCMHGCRLDPDTCPEGQHCEDHHGTRMCVEDQAGCQSDQDCPQGQWCDASAGTCRDGCRLDPDDCPEGRHCEATGGGHQCVEDEPEGCQGDGDCDPGHVCDLDTHRCVPEEQGCQSDGDCDPGHVCDLDTHRCVEVQTCEDDDMEDDDSMDQAVPLRPPGGTATWEDRVACPGDDDWYDLVVTAGDELEVVVQPDTLTAELVTVDGAPVGSAAQTDGATTLTMSAQADMTLYLHVAAGEERQVYSITVTIEGACQPDTLEPNDSAGEAAALEVGDTPSLWLCAGDEDWFVVDHRFGVEERLTLGGEVGHPLQATLWAPGDPEPMVLDGPVGPGQGLTVAPFSPAGPYLLSVVTTDDEAGVLTYTVSLSETPTPCDGHQDCDAGWCGGDGVCTDQCPADPYEPNQARGDAFVLQGDEGDLRGLTLCSGDEDWFVISLFEGDGLDVTATYEGSRATLGLEIYHPDAAFGRPVASSSNQPGDSVARVGIGAETTNVDGGYLVRVHSLQPPDGATYYDLAFQVIPGAPRCQADVFDANGGNDSPEAATPLAAGSYEDLSLCRGDQDWFRVELGAGDVVSMTTTCQGEYQTRLELRDGAGNVLDMSEHWCQNHVRHQVQAAGTYYLGLMHSQGHEDQEIRGYLVTLVVDNGGGGECTPDQYEPNDTQASAIELLALQDGPQGNMFHELTICGADEDWFEIPPVCMYESLSVRIEFDNDDGDLDLELWSANSLLGTSDGWDDFEEVTLGQRNPASHFIHVYPADQAAVSYTMNVTLQCEQCDDDRFDDGDGNDDRDHATRVPLGVEQEDLHLCKMDQDWYRASFDAGANLRVQLCFHTMEADLDLTVYGPDGDALNPDQGPDTPGHSSTDNECFLLENVRAGDYLFQVQATSMGMEGDYSIMVEEVDDGVQCPGPQERRCPI